jgi:hypothetical protein
MSKENLIQVNQLCSLYEVEMSFFSHLNEFGLVEIISVNDCYFIHEDNLYAVEKIIRIQKDLNINLEGIDTVLNLLDKIEGLQNELLAVKSRLKLYED